MKKGQFNAWVGIGGALFLAIFGGFLGMNNRIAENEKQTAVLRAEFLIEVKNINEKLDRIIVPSQGFATSSRPHSIR